MSLKPGDLGVSIYRGAKPIEKPCKDCPFVADERGANYLHPTRMENLKFAATLGQPFWCHKTVYRPGIEQETDQHGLEIPPDFHRDYRQCAGANQYALKLAKTLGITPDVVGKPFPQAIGESHAEDRDDR